ncbi:hypothetical protein [uncultured Tateyamaria sp.]|uniref:hypothetical protein n=1 Tax=uncultured Tateyamaria sp. TaxID=455651 RepID=UPI00260EBAF3|nr:hypothetical protein [uncultured Tateyamaria sp.]
MRAAEYSDMSVVIAKNEATFAEIVRHIDNRDQVEVTRHQGRTDWDSRADALLATGGNMTGPEWDATVDATLHCEALRLELISAGVLKEVGQ